MSALPVRPCSDVAPVAVDWLWAPYLARGKLAILDGDPEAGKTFLSLDLAARLSRGNPLPDGQRLARPHVTLFLTAEDGLDDTIRPRADAAGGDLTKLLLVAPGHGAPLPRLPDDVPALEETVRAHKADLVVLDPLAAFLAPTLSANSDQGVRQALTPLAAMADRCRCAVLLLRHLTKQGGVKSLYRGLGSIGIAGAIRTGLLLARHPDDRTLRVLAMTKTNIGPVAPSLGFRLVSDAHGRAAVRWAGPVDLTADELCAITEPVGKRPRERAVEWLRKELSNGPRKATDVIAAAAKVGIAERTLDRVKKDLGVKSERVQVGKNGEWVWSDPAAEKGRTAGWLLPPLPDLGLDDCGSLDDLLNRLRERKG